MGRSGAAGLGVTASERFGLIILAITIVAGLMGWLIRSLWSSQTSATQENTRALKDLTQVVGQLDTRMSRMEGRMDNRRR